MYTMKAEPLVSNMSLRDLFAAAALTVTIKEYEYYATMAYKIADAMMIARNNGVPIIENDPK